MNAFAGVPLDEIEFRASRSPGPGGQNVNRRATRVEARWNVLASAAVSEEERDRVLERLASRISKDGVLRVVAYRERTQERNRRLALERLRELVREALQVPELRVKTRPSRAAKEARLTSKRRRKTKKELRKRPTLDE
ncbi:MAG: aminoacyl-tRNA hydrolase [Gemmatimonadota bacterium]|nr:MAG: aminoacyl-tRNA hydrolase [Gemmatimonadota bacterium]